MSKFTYVSEVPANIGKDCMVITMPDFLEDIKGVIRPTSNVTERSFLRTIIQNIVIKYDNDPGNITFALRFPVSEYEGVEFSTDEDLSKIVLRIIQENNPGLIDKYLEYKIVHRPMSTKLIYFVGSYDKTTAFYKQGIDLIKMDEVEEYLNKNKKVVGKPAVKAPKKDDEEKLED